MHAYIYVHTHLVIHPPDLPTTQLWDLVLVVGLICPTAFIASIRPTEARVLTDGFSPELNTGGCWLVGLHAAELLDPLIRDDLSTTNRRALGLGALQLDAAPLRRRQESPSPRPQRQHPRSTQGHLPPALRPASGGGIGAVAGAAEAAPPGLALDVGVPPGCVCISVLVIKAGSCLLFISSRLVSSLPQTPNPPTRTVAREYSQQFVWRLLSSSAVFVAPLALRRLVAEVRANNKPPATRSIHTPLNHHKFRDNDRAGGHVPVAAGGGGRGSAPDPPHDVALRAGALPRCAVIVHFSLCSLFTPQSTNPRCHTQHPFHLHQARP